ncbi:hypothetical protein IGK74_002280 [Enterococcus sp. AZ150]|uniref:hypothetical protein n=1 Tax=Enterococcus sp. AZ150 TaxID=2774866 RepID=UPI003F21A657
MEEEVKELVRGRIMTGNGIVGETEIFALDDNINDYHKIQEGSFALTTFRSKNTYSSMIILIKVEKIISRKRTIREIINEKKEKKIPLIHILAATDIDKEDVKIMLEKWNKTVLEIESMREKENEKV